MRNVLVPVAILRNEAVSSGLMDLLRTVDVTVLGYHIVPDQTAAGQARQQFEDRAVSALTDITEEFSQAGGKADYRLVFTHDKNKSIQRIAADVNAAAIATTTPTGNVERLLVGLSGDIDRDRILEFVIGLINGREITVTLFGAGEESDDIRKRLNQSAQQLRDTGIVTETRLGSGGPVSAILDAAPGHDAVILGEKAPSIKSWVFGEESERVASASVGPVLVVRPAGAQ